MRLCGCRILKAWSLELIKADGVSTLSDEQSGGTINRNFGYNIIQPAC